MKKLLRFLIGALCIAAGLMSIIFIIYLFTQGVDIMTGIAYASLIVMSTSFIGLGWVIVSGRSVKEALQDVIGVITS